MGQMRNIIYIINPISGMGSPRGLEKLIEHRSRLEGFDFEIFPSVASGDYSFLLPVIREKKIRDVVVAGGDGTISQVVGSLMHIDLRFGIIPCGSGNGLAYTAKIPKQPARALDIIFHDRASSIDGFYINDQFACMLCGLGFDAKVAHDFAQQPRRGMTTYIRQIVKNFFGAKTYSFEWKVNNTTFVTDAYFISIANSNQYGNNFTIAPKASLTDGLLDIVIVTSQNKLSVLLQTLRQILGRNRPQASTLIKNKKGIIYFQTDRLSIVNHSQAPMHIDGDPAETPEKLDIEINKRCFRLIQP
jgi:diacylglycerol kinase (ATP)